jgi:predicted ATPase
MPDLAPGDCIGGWQVQAVLGRGGTAVVYRVARPGEHAALKVPTGPVSGHQRLLREARALAALRHPHIVGLLEILPQQGAPMLLLELVTGPSLAAWLARRQRPCAIPQILALFRPLLAAMEHAHHAGWIHRDLKPSNVLLSDDSDTPVPKIADFGLAWLDDDAPRLTQTGAVLGTPGYMAPEQRTDPTQSDQRADIFALGAILFELCCGRSPFPHRDPLVVMQQAADGLFPDPRHLRPELPDALASAVVGALHPAPELRIPDCATLRHVLEGSVPWTQAPRAPRRVETWTRSPEAAATTPAPLGRAEAVARLEQLLAEHTLVTVTGPGGVGKTTLARALVAARTDAVFVDLAEATSAREIAEEVARGLGIELQQVDPASLVVRIGEVLARRPRTLLVLDTFDKLVALGPQTVERWRVPRARFLVTCREPLELAGEQCLALGPLSTDDMVVLLRRLVAAQGELPQAPDEEWRALAELLGGLPLVAELAAETIARLGPAQARQRWGERDSWLRRSGEGPERHRTLERLLRWTWEQLPPAERELLAAISVFHGGFTPDAAGHVAPVPQVAELLRELRRKHLVEPVSSPHAPGVARLVVPEHVRLYAEAQRLASGAPEAAARHVTWAAGLGSPEAVDGVHLAGGDGRVRALLAELPNLRAAFGRALVQSPGEAPGIAIAWNLAIERSGPYDTAPSDAALPHATRPGQRSALLRQRVWVAAMAGRVAEAEQQLQAHLSSGEADPSQLPRLLNTQGVLLGLLGRYPQMLSTLQQALATPPERALYQGLILLDMALLAAEVGDLPAARAHTAAAGARLEEARASEMANARLRYLVALLRDREGHLEEAVVQLGRVQRTFQRLGVVRNEIAVVQAMALSLFQLGRPAQAAALLRPALQRSIEAGLPRQEMHMMQTLAAIHDGMGEREQAARLIAESLELAQRLGSAHDAAWALRALGAFALKEGRAEEAIVLLRRSLEQHPLLPARWLLVRALAAAGELDLDSPEVGEVVAQLEALEPASRHDAWVDLAWAAHLSGDAARARAWLERAEGDAGALGLPAGSPMRGVIAELARELVGRSQGG